MRSMTGRLLRELWNYGWKRWETSWNQKKKTSLACWIDSRINFSQKTRFWKSHRRKGMFSLLFLLLPKIVEIRQIFFCHWKTLLGFQHNFSSICAVALAIAKASAPQWCVDQIGRFVLVFPSDVLFLNTKYKKTRMWELTAGTAKAVVSSSKKLNPKNDDAVIFAPQ